MPLKMLHTTCPTLVGQTVNDFHEHKPPQFKSLYLGSRFSVDNCGYLWKFYHFFMIPPKAFHILLTLNQEVGV